MKFFTWLFPPKSPQKEDSEIKELLKIIADLETEVITLTEQLTNEIKSKKTAELNLARQTEQNKHIIKQNREWKGKMNATIEKQTKVISVLGMVLKTLDIPEEDRDNIRAQLGI